MASLLGRAAHLPHPAPRRPRQDVHPRHVPLPERLRPARRAPRGLHRDRHHRSLPAHARRRRAPPDGLGRLRSAGRAVRHPDRHPPRGHHPEEHRNLPPPAQDARLLLRLGARGRHHRPGVREVDPVDLAAALQAGPRLPEPHRGQLVRRARHGPRERGGHRRAERARWAPGREAPAAPVDAQDHRLRRPPGGRSRDARLARHQGQAAPLDRPQRGRAGRLRGPGARDRGRRDDQRLHHPRRHARRRDLRGPRARAPAGAQADQRRQPRSRRGLPRRRQGQERHRPQRRHQDEDRRAHRRVRGEPDQRRRAAHLDRRLRHRHLRHRGGHGRARARRARSRLREDLRPAHTPGHRPEERRRRRRLHGCVHAR